MEKNTIGNNGLSVIAEGLQSNNTLIKLDVSTCDFSAKGSWLVYYIIDQLICICRCVMIIITLICNSQIKLAIYFAPYMCINFLIYSR